MTAEQPSVEALVERVRGRIGMWRYKRDHQWDRDATDALAALDSLTAALERAERERDEAQRAGLATLDVLKGMEARAQKAEAEVSRAYAKLSASDESRARAEAVVEAARRVYGKANWSEADFADDGIAWQLRAALTAYDTPEIEGPCDEHPIKDWGPA